MTLRESLVQLYGWALAHRVPIALAAVALPVAGTALAWLGRGGRTDRDGRAVANVVVGVGLLALVVEVVAAPLGSAVLGTSVLDADLLLLLAPVVCAAGCIAGIRWVFPLNELASVRTARDVGLFVAACLGVLWLFSRFRGWGIVFFGGLGQLVAIGALLVFLLRRLYRRAFGEERATGR